MEDQKEAVEDQEGVQEEAAEDQEEAAEDQEGVQEEAGEEEPQGDSCEPSLDIPPATGLGCGRRLSRWTFGGSWFPVPSSGRG